jgi:hypothetical protein
MSSDPKKFVEAFLAKTGFPFELQVANQFQKNGFGIHQSVYYDDPASGLPREIDILAVFHRQRWNRNFNIIFVIECKYARTPWITFSSLTQGFVDCYVRSRKASKWFNRLKQESNFQNCFDAEKNVSHGVVVSSGDEEGNKNNAYIAIQTLLNFLKAEIQQPRFSHESDHTIYIPIIAIKGKLFKAGINNSGEIECRDIPESQIFIHENIDGVIPKIHIVTDSHLYKYVEKLNRDAEIILSAQNTPESIVGL